MDEIESQACEWLVIYVRQKFQTKGATRDVEGSTDQTSGAL